MILSLLVDFQIKSGNVVYTTTEIIEIVRFYLKNNNYLWAIASTFKKIMQYIEKLIKSLQKEKRIVNKVAEVDNLGYVVMDDHQYYQNFGVTV